MSCQSIFARIFAFALCPGYTCVCERSVCVEAVCSCEEGHQPGSCLMFRVRVISCAGLDCMAGVVMGGSGETLKSLWFFMYVL